ncbi:17178_t:CDS:2, partial [Racocetra fulgida]
GYPKVSLKTSASTTVHHLTVSISSLYAYSWLDNLNQEEWMRKLIREFIEPFRYFNLALFRNGKNSIVATILGATAPNRCLGGQCMDKRRTEDTVLCCKGHNSEKFPLMIVEMIAYKSDHKRVANSLNCKLQGGDLPSCICYMEHVKEYYGFDHIIIIGELHTGILFLDCY